MLALASKRIAISAVGLRSVFHTTTPRPLNVLIKPASLTSTPIVRNFRAKKTEEERKAHKELKNSAFDYHIERVAARSLFNMFNDAAKAQGHHPYQEISEDELSLIICQRIVDRINALREVKLREWAETHGDDGPPPSIEHMTIRLADVFGGMAFMRNSKLADKPVLLPLFGPMELIDRLESFRQQHYEIVTHLCNIRFDESLDKSNPMRRTCTNVTDNPKLAAAYSGRIAALDIGPKGGGLKNLALQLAQGQALAVLKNVSMCSALFFLRSPDPEKYSHTLIPISCRPNDPLYFIARSRMVTSYQLAHRAAFAAQLTSRFDPKELEIAVLRITTEHYVLSRVQSTSARGKYSLLYKQMKHAYTNTDYLHEAIEYYRKLQLRRQPIASDEANEEPQLDAEAFDDAEEEEQQDSSAPVKRRGVKTTSAKGDIYPHLRPETIDAELSESEVEELSRGLERGDALELKHVLALQPMDVIDITGDNILHILGSDLSRYVKVNRFDFRAEFVRLMAEELTLHPSNKLLSAVAEWIDYSPRVALNYIKNIRTTFSMFDNATMRRSSESQPIEDLLTDTEKKQLRLRNLHFNNRLTIERYLKYVSPNVLLPVIERMFPVGAGHYAMKEHHQRAFDQQKQLLVNPATEHDPADMELDSLASELQQLLEFKEHIVNEKIRNERARELLRRIEGVESQADSNDDSGSSSATSPAADSNNRSQSDQSHDRAPATLFEKVQALLPFPTLSPVTEPIDPSLIVKQVARFKARPVLDFIRSYIPEPTDIGAYSPHFDLLLKRTLYPTRAQTAEISKITKINKAALRHVLTTRRRKLLLSLLEQEEQEKEKEEKNDS